MAVYKVIQDIESEDKLLGPLTLKGFIYAGIAFTCAFIEFKLLFVGSSLKYLFILVFAGPMILFGVLASPLGREQPTEVWLLSRIRYFLKPRQRIWDQEGSNDLVTVTAPKKQELHLTKELSPKEVESRLKTLALTLDTRGWAIKNVAVDIGAEAEKEAEAEQSDRLVGAGGIPQEMPVVDVRAADDIMDEKHNPTAAKFEAMMQKAEAQRKHGILSTLREFVDNDGAENRKKSNKRGANTKDLPATKAALERRRRADNEARAKRKAEEEARLETELAKARVKFATEFESGRKKANPHHELAGVKHVPTPVPAPPAPVTPEKQADNMELAQSGSAFSVATLSQLANRKNSVQQTGPDEFTISLH